MSKRIFAKILVVLFIVVGTFKVHAQEASLSKELKPSLGLGVGLLNYYGDLNSVGNHSSLINQFGYEVHVVRKISDFSDLGFSFLTGTMIGNERSPERNLNFRTDIYSIAVYGTFNLDYWLYWSDIINPYVTIGFESFEYNNKTDLVDANGSPYHYWNDGTIRNIAQSSPNAAQSSLVFRDYNYETDLRAADLDGFGKYPQLAIGVPVGIGVNLNVSDRLSFKLNTTFHFTFTDLIDNVSKNGEGIRKGNGMNDYFTFNSVSIHYDLVHSAPKSDPSDFKFPDYFVLDIDDEDGDGVVDGLDICQFTPQGVQVDEHGCPLDEDEDGVPNYLDTEEATDVTSFVAANGKTLTDEDFYEQYLKYIDSADIPVEVLYRIAGKPQKVGNYRILLGEYSEDLPEDLANKFIDEGDVIGALTGEGKTAYLTKKYGDLREVKQRRNELVEKRFPMAEIVVWDGDEYFTLDEWDNKSEKELKERFSDYYEKKEELESNYALKLGETPPDARSADKAKFFEYDDVVVLDGDSGKSDFVIGPFINEVSAKQSLEQVDRNKYPNAEVVKVNRGKAKPVGIDAQEIIAADKVGPENWNKKQSEAKPEENIAQQFEDKLVIDFGKVDDPKTQAAINKIKSQVEVTEVKDKNGDTKLITKNPQSDTYVREKVEEFKKQGVAAEVMRMEDGALVPVDLNELKEAEAKVAVNNPKTDEEKGVLSDLNGAFALDFGNAKDKKVKEAKAQIEKLTEVEEVTTASGETRLISKEPKTKEEAAEIISALKKTDIKPLLIDVKNGDLNVVDEQQGEVDKKSQEILSDLDGAFAIDFGKSDDPKTQAAKEKILAKTDAVDVKTTNGEEKFISKTLKTEAEAKQIIADLNKEGVDASLVKVEDGEVIKVNSSKEDGILSKINDAFVIDFGNTDNPKIQAAKKAIEAKVTVKEVVTADGEKKLITNPVSKAEAKALIKDFQEQGVEPVLAQVKEEKLVPVEAEGVYSPEDKKELTNAEGDYAVDFGKIETPEEAKTYNELKQKPGVTEVTDEEGNKQLIVSDPEVKVEAIKAVKNLQETGAIVNDAKVEDGDIVRTKAPIDSEEDNSPLDNLEGNFAIDFGEDETLEKKKTFEELKTTGDFEETETPEGNKVLVAKTPEAVAKAQEKVSELEAKGEAVSPLKVEDGSLVKTESPTQTTASDNPEENSGPFVKMEGEFAIDFGKVETAEKKKKFEELKATGDYEEAEDLEGNKILIAKTPEASVKAKEETIKLEAKGETISPLKVENGGLVRTESPKPIKVDDPTIALDRNENADKLEGAFAIDFGNIDSPAKKAALDQLKDQGGFEERVDESGKTSLIAKDKSSAAKAQTAIDQLEIGGEDVSAAKVENGKVVREEDEFGIDDDQTVASDQLGGDAIEIDDSFVEEPKGKYDELENKYVVKLGRIDENTPLVERGKLMNAPETIKIKNSDGSIDVVSIKAKQTEEESFMDKAYYQALGFDDSKVAYFSGGEADVIRKEELEGKYTVSVGSFKSNVSNEEVNNILSVPDIEAIETHNPDMTTYILGEYDTPEEARASVEKLIKQGLDPSIINIKKGKINVVDLGSIFQQDELDKLSVMREKAKLVKTDEVVFRVQLGAYRQKIDRNIFKGVNTLSFSTAGGITKYVTGSHPSYQEAYIEKMNMKKMGFTGAFVVAYKDGKRIKVTDLVNQEKFQQVKQSVSPVEKNLKKVEEPKKSEPQLDAKTKLVYKVQIGAYKDDEPTDKLAQFPDVGMEIYGQYKRYISGEYDNYADANNHKKTVQAKGFPKAFVVAYSNGKRVAAPGEKANVISQSDLNNKTPAVTPVNSNEPEYKLSKVLIMIQVGLYRGDIPDELKSMYASLPNLTKQVTAHGVIRYMTGNFKNLSEAAAYKEELIKQGFPDAFLVAYYDSDRVKMSEIVEILKKAR